MTLGERWRRLLGLASKRSCYRADGRPKQRYPTRGSAEKAARQVSGKTGRDFDVYRCWFHCRRWHFGGTVRA